MTGTRYSRMRPAVALIASAVFAASLLIAPPATAATNEVAPVTTATSPTASGLAKSANLSLFRPGNIISDAVFFNSSSMNASQIDGFFRGKVGSCQSGYTCLKDYRQNTPNRAADQYCNGYSGAGNESAATIIYKVAQSCGINPQVFIVMLQKEQGLITHTWPSSWRYDMALGQGCPDTAPCDPAFAGFFYQIYGAGRQMKIYTEGRWFTYYAPGKTWNILYHPNRACGTAPVHVENKATSALYYYTPYQPNAAALRAGYGEGDGCSSYGNRNFFQYFWDWFGDPQGFSVTGAIYEMWAANGAASGWIGRPTGAMRGYGGAGWSQTFQNADIYVRVGQTAKIVTSPVREEFAFVGGVLGGLGWPTTNHVAVLGGGYQDFTGGRMYVRPDGAVFSVSGETYTTHESVSNISGILGWPTGRAYQTADGWRQNFDKGAVLQSAKASVAVTSDFVSLYDRLGGYGQFGSASTGVVGDAVGSHVEFTSGWIQKDANGMTFVKGPLGAAYIRHGGASGELGYVSGGEQGLPSGVWTQPFTGGALYDTRRGVFAVTAFAAELAKQGGPDVFGYPSGDQVVDGQRKWQPFGSRSLGSASPSSPTYVITGSINTHYAAAGPLRNYLGAPTGPERYANGGWTQQFEGGTVFCCSPGAYGSPTSIVTVLNQNGGVTGRLGWPKEAPVITNDTARQLFAGGGIFVSSAGAFTIKGSLGVEYVRRGAEKGSLGWPIANERLVDGLWTQQFQNGTLVLNANGSFSVR